MDIDKPKVSVIVIIYNMQREAPRTLHSLSPAYQREISAEDYEVLVYENGSDAPLSQAQIDDLPDNFRYHYIENASPSPVFALNQGLREARGDVVGTMIDGARIVTPGILARALGAAQTHSRPVVATLGWYLGHDLQRHALQNGYSKEAEDQLLQDINWPDEPYRLFEIAVQDESSTDGWFSVIAESNALFMRKEQWQELGGFDERFDAAGGGLINLDTFYRACTWPGAQLLMLTDEATFHQTHGGTATNTPPEVQQSNIEQWRAQYREIRGEDFSPLENANRILYGKLRPEMARAFARSLVNPTIRRHSGTPEHHNLMGRIPFNTGFWCNQHHVGDINKKLKANSPFLAVLKMARDLFAANRLMEAKDICRMLVNIDPDDEEVTRILRMCANVGDLPKKAPPQRWAKYLAAVSDAQWKLGYTEEAEQGWRRALELDPHTDSARNALAKLELPGPDYYAILGHLHKILQPDLYFEIGVFKGHSLSVIKPPTRVVGVDPELRITVPTQIESTMLPWESDTFFASTRATELLEPGFDLAFLDGLHEFPQLVRDFWHAERYSNDDSVIVLHDTVPFDDYSATPDRQTNWWTGDVWKLMPLLLATRPDLEIFVIRTPPSGLAVIRGLKSAPVISLEDFEAKAREFDDLGVDYFRNNVLPELEQVRSNFQAVTQRMQKTRNGEQKLESVG